MDYKKVFWLAVVIFGCIVLNLTFGISISEATVSLFLLTFTQKLVLLELFMVFLVVCHPSSGIIVKKKRMQDLFATRKRKREPLDLNIAIGPISSPVKPNGHAQTGKDQPDCKPQLYFELAEQARQARQERKGARA